MLAGFDLLKIDGEGLRDRPLVDRRKALVNLLRRRPNGIVLSDERSAAAATFSRKSASSASTASSPSCVSVHIDPAGAKNG
ncbi:hypothetical protein NKJ67_19175 [Mesorhizobium sp. M0088]